MARRTTDFQTIHSEGGLLPPDLLRRVLDPKAKLDGTQPEDYGLPQDERLNEVITQSWNRLRKHWGEFRAATANLAEGEAGTGITNDKWSLPLLRELGFGLLPTSAGPEVGGRTYAINRFFGPVPVHLVGCGLSLDRRAAGVRGAAAINPHGLVQEFINRSSGHRWAVVSNGLRFRILRDNQALSRQSFLEFDLEAMFAGEVYSDFVLLWLIAHATRLNPREAGRPETCWLEDWTKLADEQGTRALGDLRGGVERALQILGEGFTSHPKNTTLRDALRTGQVKLADFHGQLLRVVYRLIFLFVAEDRTLDGQALLHPRDDADAAHAARLRFADYYGTARLREMAAKIKGSRHGDLWYQFQILDGALSGDAAFAAAREHLALPALGSFLWDPASTAALNDAELTNHDFLEALRNLAFTRQGKVLRPVDYRNLGAEELGGVYESLLALTPQISADGARFTFAEFAGNERKTSGSYYTPDSLVQCLLDSALDPVVEEAIKSKTGVEAENAILALKVCDPAVGSGHFLVGAAHRLARHLARVRALAQGESEPSPVLYQHALRDVIGHCLYGVDVNPMAAELCRVSLWLEALEPGKPLSFLDHHIRVGNSLLGATPELIAAGLPDDAFTAIEGDDKKVCAALKKRNKQEREGQQDMLHLMVAEPSAEYNSIEAQTRGIDQAPGDTLDEIQRKAEQFHRLVVSPEYRHRQHVADAWCAAFVWRKQASASFESITTDTLRRLATDPQALAPAQAAEVERLSGHYQVFHWNLAFPEVFAKGGFDCVLGNPPWEKVKLQEREFFANLDPAIASARTAADRKRLIGEHRSADSPVWRLYIHQLEFDTKLSRFYRQCGRFPLTASGEANTYSLFAELAVQLISPHGTAGQILKTGIVNAVENVEFFQEMVRARRLWVVRDFKNWLGWFPDVGYHERFSLVTITGSARTVTCTYAFNCLDVEEARAYDKVYELSHDEVRLLNPNLPVCPVFSTRRDKELTCTVYRRFPPLVLEVANRNQWGVQYQRMFDMTADSGEFRQLEELVAEGYIMGRDCVFRHKEAACVPLLEGKHIHSYTHRFATYEGIREAKRFGIKAATATPTDEQLLDPDYEPMPRYWVDRNVWQQQCARTIAHNGWCIAFRDVTNLISNARTTMATIAPARAFGNSAALLFSENTASALHSLFLLATLNSIPFDFLTRQKLFGAHLNKYILWQLPVPVPSTFCSVDSELTELGEFVFPRALELSYVTTSLAQFAQNCGWAGPPFRWNEDRRFLLRCELDAAFFHLYLPAEKTGVWRPAEGEAADDLARLKASFATPRDAVPYIMDTFPIVRRRDEEKYDGDYRTKRVILEIYDAIQVSVRTGQPYQTPLDPPPADPRCCHLPRVNN